MNLPKDFLKMVEEDIERLGNADQLSFSEQLRLHREIDGRYQSCISDWYSGLEQTRADLKLIFYRYLEDQTSPKYVSCNLQMMKAKLETYRFGMNAVQLPGTPATNATVNNTVNVSVTF